MARENAALFPSNRESIRSLNVDIRALFILILSWHPVHLEHLAFEDMVEFSKLVIAKLHPNYTCRNLKFSLQTP